MEIKVGGIVVPVTVAVVQELSFDLILGMDYFTSTDAVVDVQNGVLTLFNRLTSVPMTMTRQHPVAATVSAVSIPPYSEAVFPVVTKTRLPRATTC